MGANIPRNFPTNVRVSPAESGLPLETVFLCFQLRSIDPSRFPSKSAGRLDAAALKRVEDAMRNCLGL
jgi:mRNA interferase MazF